MEHAADRTPGLAWDDVIDVLTKISAYDRRTVEEPEVMAWSEFFQANPWITKPLAMEAVRRHFDSSGQWLKQVNIKYHARAAKESLERDAAANRARQGITTTEVKNPMAYRRRDPERWDRLYRDGRLDGAVKRARELAKFEERDQDRAEDWARNWIQRKMDAEDRGVPHAVPAFMPWPPRN